MRTRRFVAALLFLALFGINGAAIAEAISLARPQGPCCSHCSSTCQCRRTARRGRSDAPGLYAPDKCEGRCGCRRTLLTFHGAPAVPALKASGRLAAIPADPIHPDTFSGAASSYPAFLYDRPPPIFSL